MPRNLAVMAGFPRVAVSRHNDTGNDSQAVMDPNDLRESHRRDQRTSACCWLWPSYSTAWKMPWSGSRIATAAIAGSTGRFSSTTRWIAASTRRAPAWKRSSARPTTTCRRPSWPTSFAWMMSMCSPAKRIVNRIEMVGQPDGQTVWNVTNKIPLFDADGSIIGTAGITRRLNAPDRDSAGGSEFGPVLAYMRDHYHSPITNQQLARLAHMSVRAFERKFRGSFHLTPQKYLRKLQLRMASRALVYTDQALAEVAVGCGFADQSHFTREFRRHFGRTPRDYREHYAPGSRRCRSWNKFCRWRTIIDRPPPLYCSHRTHRNGRTSIGS